MVYDSQLPMAALTADLNRSAPAMEDALPAVACVVVNWNGWRDTLKCLEALGRSTYSNLTVLVVDNGSTNESVVELRAAHPSVPLFENKSNLGFAGGNNVAIRYALGRAFDYVWLLNNDTEPAPDALSALVAKAASDPRIGAVSSVCYYYDAPEKVQVWAGARLNLWVGYIRNSTRPQSDEWFHSLYGASLLIAADAIREVGLLDEGFFHSWEETEFCLRLREKGWRLAAAPSSRILHKVSGSTGGASRILDRYFTASGLRILRLHSPAPPVAMMVFLAMRFVRRAFAMRWSDCASVWQGVRDYLRMVPVTQRIR